MRVSNKYKANKFSSCFYLEMKIRFYDEECVFLFQGHNIFSNMNSEEYAKVMSHLKSSILATDMSLHMQ